MGKIDANTVAISVRALLQRINRKLGSKGQLLKRSRGERQRTELGAFYLLHTDRNVLLMHHVNLEVLGRELGALESWERLAH